MGSTRQTPLLQIYQDVEPSFDHEHGIYAESHAHPLQPMGNASFKKNVIFDRPLTGLGEPSPSKPTFASSASPSRHPMNNRFNLISIPPPQETTAISDSPVKNSTYTTFNGPTIHKPQKVLFSTFPSSKGNDKENRAPPAPSSENFAEFPDPVASQRSSAKRALLEAPVLRDRAAKRPKKEEDASYQLPEPAEMPQIRDDGSKPPYSYATLIGMAILRAPNRRLTLAQIYKWISETFGYYHNSETGWQNSIRHNLSLNKAFVKQERPKDDPGKGNYWAIEPGMEGQFLKDKLARRPVSLGMSANPSSKKQSSETPSQRDGRTERRLSLDHEVKVREELELSSDATLPASDPAFNEPDILGEPNMPPPTSRHIHSSPPQLIHSSPPVPHHSAHQETSPPGESYPSSSQETRSRKRKLAAMNDSGYFSSIESSASRPLPARNILTSEADIDRPHTKRGRAEEEIARIRQSSHDSPTGTRGLLRQPSHPLMSSSPLRHFDSSLMLPPFTPVAALKLPPRPPLSVSPNANLRNHRNKIKQLVGSPVRNLGILNDEIPWSPAFTIDDDSYNLDEYRNGLQGDLEIFADNAEDILAKAPHLSPTKMSIKRPRLDRMHTTPNILAEGTKRLEHSVSPILGLRSMSTSQSPYKDFSPSKPYSFDTSILDLTQEDMFDGDLFEDAPGLEDGVDILQGFQKIGKGKDENKITTTKVRPKLGSVGRSFTSRF